MRSPAAALLLGLIVLLLVAPMGPRALRAGSPGSASPGTVRGIVDLKRPAAKVDPRPDVASLGEPRGAAPPEVRPAVVYLEAAPRGAFEPDEGAHAVMNQHNQTFVPHVLAITVGTAVDFPNSDRVYHNVFSLSRTRTFDLGRYALGHSKSVRFDRPGVVQVFCDIHSHMSAYILVFAHRFFAVTDEDGRYRIDNVPPGRYSVAMWYEGLVRATKPVTIPDGGGAVDLDFSMK